MSPKETVEKYLEAYYSGNTPVARAQLADDFVFEGPRQYEGADNFLRASAHVARAVTAVETRKVFEAGSDICVFYDLVVQQQVGRIAVAEWYRVVGGKIAWSRLIMDTAPFLQRRSTVDQQQDATDPVCGMLVSKDSPAATREHAGVQYYFCNPGCATAFEEDPERYLSNPDGRVPLT